MINRELFSIALVTTLTAGLPALAAADVPQPAGSRSPKRAR